MIIAEQKRKENIAEYLLYMYQVEDMIRANRFDLENVEHTLISKFEVTCEVKRDMREWYKSLIAMIHEEQKEEKGHLNILENVVDQLHEMHNEIIQQGTDTSYKGVYDRAKVHIETLRTRSGYDKDNNRDIDKDNNRDNDNDNDNDKDINRDNDIQVALNGLYGLFLLKLKKTPITEETTKAFDTISELVAELSLRYMEGTR